MRLSEELRGRTKQYASAIIRFNMSVFQKWLRLFGGQSAGASCAAGPCHGQCPSEPEGYSDDLLVRLSKGKGKEPQERVAAFPKGSLEAFVAKPVEELDFSCVVVAGV
jgi:hypothetical protein